MNIQPHPAVLLQKRFISFAAQIVRLCSKLDTTAEGRHISKQILRSATATAANYGEARGAESRSDFIHKLRIVLKELNETTVWLELIQETSLLSQQVTDSIIAENQELCRIVAASIKTARTAPSE
jgi:four helix bundle protein